MTLATPLTPAPAGTVRRIVIVAEHASARFGGEAALPLHYFRLLAARGLDVHLVTHARVRGELAADFPQLQARTHYIEDTALHRWMWRLGRLLPARLAYFSTGFVSRLSTQFAQRRRVAALVRAHGIQVVHQPMPVSPREPSLMHGVGAPVVIGPMNGGMHYPPAFVTGRLGAIGFIEAAARRASGLMNRLLPGKRRAALLLVANERTRAALPPGLSGAVEVLPENGVDLSLWAQPAPGAAAAGGPGPVRFVFMGRLVDWKAVDLLLLAFARAKEREHATLTLIGDGPEAPRLKALAAELGLLAGQPDRAGRVHFAGWQTQPECARRLREQHVLVLPSLWECGGAVVLEAMACGLPVLATAWGGPLDYLDEHCGLLVPPQSREALVQGLADGIDRLATQPALRAALGARGRERVAAHYGWEHKVEQMLALYARVCRPPA